MVIAVQTVMLELADDGALLTCDDPPVQVGSMSAEAMTACRLRVCVASLVALLPSVWMMGGGAHCDWALLSQGGALLRFNIHVAKLDPVQITTCQLAGKPIPLRGIGTC